MSVNLIIPSAGQSSRFPTRPKWLLTQPTGDLMIHEAIGCLDLTNIKEIFITVLKEHIDKYCNGETDFLKFNDIKTNVLILDQSTNSQCETVVKTIQYWNIEGSIFIKDVDNYFITCPKPENSISYVNIKDYTIRNITNKSFIELNNINVITNIVEKKVISDKISVGGYSFENAKDYIDAYNKLLEISKEEYQTELYTSHIIWNMMTNKSVFQGIEVKHYFDWGTYEDWIEYKNQFKTFFIDIDGVLVENSSEYFSPKWGETNELKNNLEWIKSLDRSKVDIILTTARKKEYKEITEKQLNSLGITYDAIIFDLLHCKRYLINDYSKTNPYPTAIAVNSERNSDNLKDLIKDKS